MYSEKNLIKKITEEHAESADNSSKMMDMLQTAYSFGYNIYLLITIVIVALLSFVVVFVAQGDHLIQTTIWSFVGVLLTGGLYFYAQLIRQKKKGAAPVKAMHRYMQISSFSLGAYISIGTLIVLHYNGLPTQTLTYAHTGWGLIFIIVSIVGLGALTSKLQYMALFYVTANLGGLIFLLSHPHVLIEPPFYYLGYLFFIAFMCGMINEEYRTRRRIYQTYIEHNNLLHQFENQKELAELGKIQLESEIHHRKTAEKKLKQYNIALEDKIKERTDYIEKINANLIRSKQSLEMAQQAAGISSWDWDLENKVLTGKNFENLLGYSTERIGQLAKDISAVIYPDDFSLFQEHLRDVINRKDSKLDTQMRIKNSDNDWLWVEFKGTCISEDPLTKRPKRMVGICRDITIERSINDSLSLSNSVFEQSAEAIFVLDKDLRYISVNPSFERVMGFTQDDMKGKYVFLSDHTHRNQDHYQEILDTLAKTGEFSGEISERSKSGERLFLHVSINIVHNEDGEVVNYIGIFSDLTQQTQDRQRLSYLANYDTLTDLPNRTFFNQQLHTLITEQSEKFAVIRINIDRFRILNNSLGSKNADLLLKLVSERLSQLDYSVRALARTAGDDFAVLLNHLSLHSLKKYVDNILDAFKKPFFIEGKEVNVSLSVGISLYPQHGHQVDTLMGCAEQALKRAKLNGGKDYFIYNLGLEVSSIDSLQLETDLRRAISHGELVVFYQPKIRLKTGELDGFEALVRWHHAQKGLLLPGDFIDLAAEIGLINDLSIEVLTQTCHQIKTWQDSGFLDTKVAVNIEAKQLQRGNFLSMLDTALSSTGITGSSLEIEITESSLIDMPEKIKPLLTSIKSRDISIALDDFGTGYSSLSYLSQFPIDVIKIDRSFICDVSTNTQSAAIVRAIIAMGQSLGMSLVAEGVENTAQRSFLTSEGCQIAQGYYYGKPMPANEATKLMERERDRLSNR